MAQNSAVLNLKFHYRVHKSPPVVQVLKEKEFSPLTPALFIKVPTEYYLLTYYNILFLLTVSSSLTFRGNLSMQLSFLPRMLHVPAILLPHYIW